MSCKFQSNAGYILNFSNHSFLENWPTYIGGIYIFAKFDFSSGNYFVLYVGKTDSFERRMGEHRYFKWKEAVSLGATCVLASVVESEPLRRFFEDELINCYCPPLNIANNPSRLRLGDGVSRYSADQQGRRGIPSFNRK